MKTLKNLTADELRKSIMQLAVEGKLVKQDPADEPASALVDRIRKEKNRLIREKKIKADKNESVIYKDGDEYYEKVGNGKPVPLETPFDIPDSWTWVRQRELCTLDNGQVTHSGILPYLEAKAIRSKTPDSYRDYGVVVDSSSVLILVDGENSGEIFNPPFCGYMGSTFKKLDIFSGFNPDYLLLVFALNKDYYRGNKTGVAIPHLNKNIFKNTLVPLPPLEEQKRIVEKIQELDPLLTTYQDIEAKLSALENRFEEKLKASIIQYAIEGKLVKQDPSDEPASELVKQIQKEKQRLIKEGKIKPDKKESQIYKSSDKGYYEKVGDGQPVPLDTPFDIPDSWTWVRLSNICNITIGKTPSRHNENYWDKDYFPWLSIADMRDHEIVDKTHERISEKAFTEVFGGKFVAEGTLLMSFKLTIGKMSIAGMNMVFNEAIAAVDPYMNDGKIKKWLFTILSFLAKATDATDAIKGKTLNKEKLSNILIPLPPINEEIRIAEGVESIFIVLSSIALHI